MEAFKCHQSKSFTNLFNILNSRDLPCLINEQTGFYKIELGEKELHNALKYMPNNKTPRNDGLSKQFHGAFLNEFKHPLSKSFYHAKTYKRFSTEKGKP